MIHIYFIQVKASGAIRVKKGAKGDSKQPRDKQDPYNVDWGDPRTVIDIVGFCMPSMDCLLIPPVEGGDKKKIA